MPKFIATVEVWFETYDADFAPIFADALGDCVMEYDAAAHLDTAQHPVRITAVASSVAPEGQS
jgi:hypothetical protein